MVFVVDVVVLDVYGSGYILFIVVIILFYCSRYIILLCCLYYFIVLKAKINPLMLDVL